MNHIRIMLSAQARKAWVAAGVAAIGSATIAAPGGITLPEALTIIGAALGAFQATYWTTNADAPTPPTQLASATPIHDALAAQYDVATPVEPQP